MTLTEAPMALAGRCGAKRALTAPLDPWGAPILPQIVFISQNSLLTAEVKKKSSRFKKSEYSEFGSVDFGLSFENVADSFSLVVVKGFSVVHSLDFEDVLVGILLNFAPVCL